MSGVFRVLSFLTSISDIFRLKNCIYLFTKNTGQYMFSFLPFLTFQSTQSVKILETNAWNLWKLQNFGIFVFFWCQFKTILIPRTRNYLFKKHYWTTNFFLVDPFKLSNLRSLSNIHRKSLKTLKIENVWVFCHVWCQFEKFVIQKTLRKSLLDYNSFLVDPFQHPNSRSLLKI